MSAAIVEQMCARLRLQGRAFGVGHAKQAAFDALQDLAVDAGHLVGEAVLAFGDVVEDLKTFHELRSLDQVLDETNRRLEAGL